MLYHWINQKIREWFERINTMYVGRVKRFDPATHRGVIYPNSVKALGEDESQNTDEIPLLLKLIGLISPIKFKGKQRLNGSDLLIHERPDLHFRNSQFGSSIPWDDGSLLVCGTLQRDSDNALDSLKEREAATGRLMHLQDSFIMGALLPESESPGPSFGKSWVPAYLRSNPAKRLEFTPGGVWFIVGVKVIIISNDGEVKIENAVTGHKYHISPEGDVTMTGKSVGVSSDDGDLAVNGRGLLAEMDAAKEQIEALEQRVAALEQAA
jgi:hypothetical protein